MNIENAEIGMRVEFTPRPPSTEAKQRGEITSISEKYIFVKFDYVLKAAQKAGLDDTHVTAQACRPEDLTKLVRVKK